MKKKNLMAAAATTCLTMVTSMASCTNNDMPVEPKPQSYTMTVRAEKRSYTPRNLITRALSLEGTTLNSTWSVGDKVIVMGGVPPGDWEMIGELQALEAGSTTTLKGTLDKKPTADCPILLMTTHNLIVNTGQKGTLEDIAANYDLGSIRIDEWSETNGAITTQGTVEFYGNPAIVKFTYLDKADGTTLLSPSAATISIDAETVELTDIPAETYSANGEGVLFVAMPPIRDKAVNITLKVGSSTYTYSESGMTFISGYYYDMMLEMNVNI